MTETAARPDVELQLLGPLQVLSDGAPQALGGPRQRGILALLLINRNRVVPVDALVDAVWGEAPPAAVVSSVHVAVSGIRRLLPAAGGSSGVFLATASPGYRLTVPDRAYDLARFQEARDRGVQHSRAGRHDAAASDLATALAIWRGEPLEDLTRFRFVADFAAAVGEERLLALQLKIDSELLCGRAEAVLPELTDLTARHPLREHLWAQLATALYRVGRQADALTCLHRLRTVLDDELGIDPTPAIQDLELKILRQDLHDDAVTAQRVQDLAATIDEPVVGTSAELITSWGAVYPIFARGTQIGRAPECDVVVDDERVSRWHAMVVPTSDGLVLRDSRSRNGTYLNGRLVLEGQLLGDGDVIGVGRVSLTVRESGAKGSGGAAAP